MSQTKKSLFDLNKPWGHRPRSPINTIGRLTRNQLFKLIQVCPEISTETVESLFSEYEYGINPSFRIFVCDNCKAQFLSNVAELSNGFDQEFETVDSNVDPEVTVRPTFQRLQLNRKLKRLDEFPSVIEGNYRYLKRLDYIDECQELESTYETLYGYFWINVELGYIAIHGRHDRIVRAIRSAFESVTGISLLALVITKQLRQMLPILKHGTIRSSQFRNLNPDSGSVDSVTIRGKSLDPTDLQQYEEDYPEIPHRRYRLNIDEDKISSVAVTDTGSISLTGRITATQFRNWCLLVLEEVMEVWQDFRKTPESHLETIDLDSSLEFRLLRTKKKKAAVLEILNALLTLQDKSDESIVQLSISPLAFAEAFTTGVMVQIPFVCNQLGCGEDGYYQCSHCDSDEFIVRHSDGWHLKCLNSGHRSCKSLLPLNGECEKTHPYVLDEAAIESDIEIFLDTDLLQLLEDVVEKYIRGYSFDSTQERFYIKGKTLVYQRLDHIQSAETQPTQINKHYHAKRDINLMESDKVDAGTIVQGGDNQISESTNGPDP